MEKLTEAERAAVSRALELRASVLAERSKMTPAKHSQIVDEELADLRSGMSKILAPERRAKAPRRPKITDGE